MGNNVFAQISCGGLPPSFQSAASLPVITELAVEFNTQELKAKSQAAQSEENSPPCFAKAMTCSFNMSEHGTWSKLSDGEALWQLRIKAQGALALILAYDQFYIPEGGKLFIYSADKSMVLGAYTSNTNPYGGAFSTEMVAGDDIVLEYWSPLSLKALRKTKNANEIPSISIDQIGYVYDHVVVKHFAKEETKDTKVGESSTCMINVNCSEGDDWQEVKNGVVRMIMYVTNGSNGAGWYLCSGSVMNNTAQDLTPYVLTAYHCYDGAEKDDLSKWQFTFGYESLGCGDEEPENTHTIVGSYLRAYSPIDGGSDGLLLELYDDIPSEWNVYYNGWDRTNEVSAGVGVGIHHPAGDIKKISTYNTYSSSTWTGVATGDTDGHWYTKFVSTDNGYSLMEGGSSGSPMFNHDQYVIGTLTGGYADCDEPGTNSIFYGKLWYHWDQYGNADSTQMKPWLDPLELGVTTFNGTTYDPSAPRITADVSTLELSGSNELLVAGKFDTIVVEGANLTEGILAEVNGPFELSQDTLSWNSQVDLASDGGNLFIHFLPNSIGLQTGQVSLTSQDADTYSIYLTASSCPDMNFDYKQLPDASLLTYYSTILSVSNASTEVVLYEVTNGSLPVGLALDESSGELTGVPEQVGSFVFTILVTDENGCFASFDYTLTVQCVSIESFPYVQDFENGSPACWEEVIETGAVNWSLQTGGNTGGSYPNTAYSGSYNLCYRSESYAENSNYYIMPPLDVTDLNHPVLSFAHTQTAFAGDQDELEVYYKLDADASWNLLAAYTNNISEWTLENIALEEVSSTYYVGFRGQANYGYGITLDQVIVASPALSASPARLGTDDFTTDQAALITQLTVSGNDLLEPITLLPNNLFSYSNDQQVWDTIAELPASGGTIYLKYAGSSLFQDTLWLASTATELAIPIDGLSSYQTEEEIHSRACLVQNPFYNQLEVELLDSYNELKVLDALGHIVYRTDLSVDQVQISISSKYWSTGLYTLYLSSGEKSVVKKIIKR